jgi:hypothetical protein
MVSTALRRKTVLLFAHEIIVKYMMMNQIIVMTLKSFGAHEMKKDKVLCVKNIRVRIMDHRIVKMVMYVILLFVNV